MRVAHVITGLNTGGAEMMLLKLVSASTSEATHRVFSLGSTGTMGRRFEELGVHVEALGLRPGRLSISGAYRLCQAMRRFGPDIVQGWMYHANLAALVATWLGRRRWALAWSVRCTIDPQGSEKALTRLVVRLCAALSNIPYAIVYNSDRSRQQHESLGYRDDRSRVIPNGFDTSKFCPSDATRTSVREALGIRPDERLVGLVTRLDPMKDQRSFLRAAVQVLELYPSTRFVLAGRNVPSLQYADEEAQTLIAKLGGNVKLLDEQECVSTLLSALDVFVLSSAYGEGFPNVVGEAMACGVPCVVTDVGDCASIVEGTGVVVPPRNSGALAEGIGSLLGRSDVERRLMGAAARQTIERRFSVEKCKLQFEGVWHAAVKSVRRA